MIEVHNLTKSFGPHTALQDVTFSIETGASVTLVGPNGAGKTTLLRILATLSRPSGGTIRVGGLDIAEQNHAVRQCIGFLSHKPLLYEDLTAEENLRFYARMYNLGDIQERVETLLDRVELLRRRDDLVRTFSRGMQQRLSVARALLHRPQVLLLDEPYTGLDSDAVQMLLDLLQDLSSDGSGECTLLLTTHNLAQGLRTGRRVMILHRGRLVYDVLREAIDVTTFSDTYRRLTMRT
ncbi:MAG TPA: heme ABC exporter ATP-binding protein CcmA [Chloroflexi bacterium]|nr:heme ABC exporter ATP-binding protein CcmA [Chloroflexota bacterium]